MPHFIEAILPRPAFNCFRIYSIGVLIVLSVLIVETQNNEKSRDHNNVRGIDRSCAW